MSKNASKQVRKTSRSQNTNRLLLWIGLIAIVIIALGTVLFIQQKNSNATAAAKSLPKEISVDDAAFLRDSGAFVLDVRQPEEWVEYHIPGATLIPLDQLENRLSEVPQGKEVVVVCRSGNRSQVGRDILLNADFEQVTSMSGGMNQWMSAGHEWVTGQ
jgi:rhodanese-related sulfurtransferase